MAEQQEEKNPLAIETKKPKKKITNVFKGKKPITVVGLVLLALVLVGAAIIAAQKVTNEITKEKTLQNIVIGDITITPQDVSEYAQLLRDSIPGDGPKYDESEENIAIKSLVLNAALIKEAKENNIQLTDEEIVASTTENAEGEELQNAVKTYQALPKNDKITQQNIAYQQKLENSLIIKKSLLIAYTNFDTPYHKNVSEDKLPGIYSKTLEDLNNTILPLMRSGASADEIAKKAKVNLLDDNKKDDNNVEQYSEGTVLTVMRMEDYAPGQQKFNDLEDTSYIRGDVGQLFNTDEKLASLNNPGDTTEVFASKAGIHMTARLESKNNGKYGSWDDMTQNYIDDYVKYAGIHINSFVASLKSTAIKTADKAVLAITSPGLEEAKALGYSCSAHTVRYNIVVFRKTPGANSGTAVSAGALGSVPRIGYTPQPAACVSNPNVNNNQVSAGSTAYADCMTFAPNWGSVSNHPNSNNWNFVGLRVSPANGNAYSANSYPWVRGPNPDDRGPIWNPGQANAFSDATIYVFIMYEPASGGDEGTTPTGGGTAGKVHVALQSSTDGNCTIFGLAFFRPNGTSGAQDVPASWRISGSYTFPGGGGFAGPNTGRYDSTNNRKMSLGFPNPAAVFPDGNARSFTLTARYTIGGVNYGDSTTKFIVPPQPFGCNVPPDYGAELTLTADCNGATLWGRDRNGTSGYVLQVYHTGLGQPGIYQPPITGPLGSSGTTVGIPLNLPVVPGGNNGYWYTLTVYEIGIYGNITGSRTIGVQTPVCFTGNCAVSVTPSLAGKYNGVRDTDVFTVNATINDTGQRRVPVGNLAIAMRNIRTGAVTWGNSNGGFANGRTNYTFQVGPINSLTQLEFYPDYAGYFPIGGVCRVDGTPGNPGGPGTTVDVYQRFDIFPNANGLDLRPDNESPTSVGFNWGMSNSATTVNNITATRSITRDGTSIYSTGPQYDGIGATTQTDTTAVTTTASVRYCGQVTISPAAGWVGPLDTATNSQIVVTTANRSAGPSCDVVGDKPYVRVYGGDVGSGVNFSAADGTCNLAPADSGIYGYMRPAREQVNGGKSGSGGQLGVFSRGGDVNGFTSAFLRATNPAATALNALTFSNSVGPINNTDLSPALGKQLTSGVSCMPDYFNDTQYSDGSQRKNNGAGTVLTGFGGLDANEQTVYNGDLTINAMTGYNTRHTIYVDGDVILRGNITYAAYNVTNGDFSSIPNFTLVASGTIYVDRGVTQLDGTYIAQPRSDGSGGKIYSCASGRNTFVNSASALFSSGCDANKLRVNGTFLAERVVLNRTINSLRDSAFKEPANTSNAAEIFTFSPDVYLSPPVFRPKSTVTSGDYEYIATLPPVL